MTVAPDGAIVTAPTPAAVEPHLRYRQSTVRSYATGCPRATVLASQQTTGSVGSSADLGSAFAAVAAEVRRTLYRHQEPQMSTEEAVNVMREVLATGPWILSPADYNGDGTSAGLVQMVCNLADEKWQPGRFMVIEGQTRPFDGVGRMSVEIPCPDGEIRTFTGAPDLIVSDPPHAIRIIDDKTGQARPTDPREMPPDGEPIRGVQYLTAPRSSFFQLVGYFAIAAAQWPSVQHATLAEKNWRWNSRPREATISRADLEHLLPYLGDVMMKLDRGLREGDGSDYAKPRPCSACNTRCPVNLTCPVPAEQRGVGVLSTPEQADTAAARWVAVKAVDKRLREAIKSHVEESGRPAEVGDGSVIGWKPKANGKGRDFCVHHPEPPADTAATDDAFVESLEAELARTVPA